MSRAPAAGMMSRDVLWALALVATVSSISVAVAATDGRADALLRHGYVVAVLAAAARWGFAAGAASGAVAALLHAPLVLSAVERDGLTRAAQEGLVTLAMLVVAGGVTGAVAGAARRERGHHTIVRALQRAVGSDEPVDAVARRLSAELGRALAADVTIVLAEGGPDQAARRGDVAAHAVEQVLGSGATIFVPDVDAGPRVARLVAVPITVRDERAGAMVVRRPGDIGGGERASLAALGAALGLALENGRLLARQREFTAELAERVASARREAETLDRAKSAFVATTSHELRTPLTALRGFSELLATRVFPPEDVARFGRIIAAESERLGRLVEDLLDLSRLEHGLEPPVRRTAVDVRAALERATQIFARDAGGQRLEIEAGAGLPAVSADPDALDRIVKNLVSNAIKYAPEGPIRVTARDVGDDVEFSVADRGAGIPADALPRLFDPYFRVPETAQTVRGTGIGLAVVKALVEAHGGAIRVASTPGEGTCFVFTVPTAATSSRRPLP
jgi:signal transduction histidine kinase